MSITALLQRAEFVRLRYRVRLTEAIDLDLPTLLRLRRNFRAAGQYALLPAGGRSDSGRDRFSPLFSPPVAVDPVARQRYQRSGAAFVLQPDPASCRSYARGELLTFPVVLWGGCQEMIGDLARVFQALGQAGLRYDAGRFELIEIAGQDSSGRFANLWHEGESLATLQSPLRDAEWWLSTLPVGIQEVTMAFVTPARLIQHQRPLFQPDFNDLFPFILRRVSSMLYAHCRLELVDDPSMLLALAREVHVAENRLLWQDWRTLGPDADQQHPLGGLMGTVTLRGAAIEDLFAVLELGTLMNLGKNAAYGAGQYRLIIAER